MAQNHLICRKDYGQVNFSRDVAYNVDAYPSFNEEHTTLYFTSNKGGDFDIYSTPLSGEFEQTLTGSQSSAITKELTLSSDDDDKCPYVNGDIIVFTSNRPGGYGGFDLYYSKRTGSNWSKNDIFIQPRWR